MKVIQLPISKSIANRCLVLTALSGERPDYLNINKASAGSQNIANDVLVMHRLLFSNNSNEYDVEDAGTVFRFLTSYLAIKDGNHRIYGTPKLNSRPIQSLVDALIILGADITYANIQGQAPLKISGKKIPGGEIQIDASLSSQFVSSLMLIAPTLASGLKIHLQNASSLPYIALSKKCLEYFGVATVLEKETIAIPYSPEMGLRIAKFTIEKDWSSAAFWYALCAVTGKAFSFPDLKTESIQGDKVCAVIFQRIGVQTTVDTHGIRINRNGSIENNLEFHLQDCPDIAPALIVACGLKKLNARFYGLYTLAFKESSRVEALQTELKKIGIEFTKEAEHWILIPKPELNLQSPLVMHTYNDHRLAMAFACVKAMNKDIEIENPDCVRKSYPGFWEEYDRWEIEN